MGLVYKTIGQACLADGFDNVIYLLSNRTLLLKSSNKRNDVEQIFVA